MHRISPLGLMGSPEGFTPLWSAAWLKGVYKPFDRRGVPFWNLWRSEESARKAPCGHSPMGLCTSSICGTMAIVEAVLSTMVVEQAARAERVGREMRAVFTGAMWRSGIAAGIHAWRFSKAAARLANSVIWMRGAQAFLMEKAHVVDPEDKVTTSLRQLAIGMLELHDQVVTTLPVLEKAHIGGTRGALQRALRELAKQSGALHKEAGAFANELAVHDVDYAPHEAGWHASTAEEVRDLFARL